MHTITWASHEAHLDPMTGEGLLVMPDPAYDVYGLAGASLHASGWDAVVRHLDTLGWEPSEDEYGGWQHAGHTADGRQVMALYGRDPIVSMPDMEECHRAVTALAGLAGLVL